MASASSAFTGSENPLSESGAWTSGPGGFGAVQKVSGSVVAAEGAQVSGARYEGAVFTGDHESEIVILTGGASYPAACTRIQGTTDCSCYYLEIGGVNSELVLYRVGPTGQADMTQLGAAFAVGTISAGHKAKLKSEGSTHTVYWNDVSQGTRSDATLTGGQPGIGLYPGVDENIASWAAADVGAPAGISIPVVHHHRQRNF